MHYWRFFCAKWLAKTCHLSMTQEGGYLRLVNWMYMHERSLPASRMDCYQIARCANSAQRLAVDFVIDHFFVMGDDGWHQKTVDEILAWWDSTGRPCNDRRNATSATRVFLFRERYRATTAALQAKGVKVPSGIGMKALKALCAEHGVTPVETPISESGNADGNGVCNALSSIKNNSAAIAADDVTPPKRYGPSLPIARMPDKTPRAWVNDDGRLGPLSRAIREVESLGLPDFDSNSAKFVQLVTAGVTADAFRMAASEAMRRGVEHPWPWALKRVEARHQESPARPLAASPRADRQVADGLVSPEGLARLRARMADPSIDDPFAFEDEPPSDVKRDDANEINSLGADAA